MSPITIAALKEHAGDVPVHAAVYVQLQSRVSRTTKAGKPYYEMTFADSTGNLAIKVWSDSSLHDRAESLSLEAILRLEAEWTKNQYGLNPNNLQCFDVDDAERAGFYAGDPSLREKQERDYAEIERLCGSILDPRLRWMCEHFLLQMGARFRRTAAARRNHHARRGGLVEHVAQMMRLADAIAPLYPELNRDLLLTGVLFHDSGKLWENSYPENGFQQMPNLYGEMLGHIPLGIELVNKLWNDLMDSEEAEGWRELKPSGETTRLHLLHLIGSHHGQLEFGSPVLPRTPEAFALHHIDNLDAKLEMVRDAYVQGVEASNGIYERVFPLPANLVRPLPPFMPEIAVATPEQEAEVNE